MDKEQLVSASSLLSGQLRSQRDNIKGEIIKLVLADFEDSFTVRDIEEKCESDIGISIDETVIVTILEDLKGDIIEKENDGDYLIENRPNYTSIQDQLNPVWVEFKEGLSLYTENVDPYYTEEMKPAFFEFFRKFFLDIADSVETLNEYQKDTIYTDYGSTEELIEDVVARHSITESGVFHEAVRGYLEEPGEELLEFTASCYTAAVNIDLLSKEDEFVEFPSIPESNRKLVLDTNVLISLLADTHVHHITADTISNRSAEMDFGLYYLSETADELDRYIRGAEHEMEGLVSNEDLDSAENAFIKDFREKSDERWGEYLDKLHDWRGIISEEYDISEYDTEKEPNSIVMEEVEELLLGKDTDLDERQMRRINHDASLLGIAGEERRHSDMAFGPFVLSFHNELTQMGQGFVNNPKTEHITGGQPLALQPRSWLNYIISFTPVNLEDEDMKDVSLAVLRAASDFEGSIELDEYVHTLAPKVGLDKKDEESLKSLLVKHPLSDELEGALKSDEPMEAERVSREILTDDEFMDAVREEREFKERIKSASSRVQELEEKVEDLEPTVSFDGFDLSEEGGFRDGYRLIYEELDDELYNPSELPVANPPSPDAEIQEIEEWLQDLIISLDEVSSSHIHDLRSQLERLLANAVLLK